ncbi:MAG TPA: encapsulin-associated ferritin-like protein [Methylomirabilota bacterium]|jgi:ferritin-like protein|nr:encapsulin-associated ferritin-like protein [Methylomirabilota bacterium]
MAQSSAGFHEAEERLSARTRDLHRALVSLMEELEAIDWYQQRVDATEDGALRAILQHNRDEEIEHAAMVLEWIRRQEAAFDARLRQYLYSEGDIVEREQAVEGTAPPPRTAIVTVGSLRRAPTEDGSWTS